MNLLSKFNLVCVSVFGIGLACAGTASYIVLEGNARGEVTRQADLMMETALAARKYTDVQIKPLLRDRIHDKFLPQVVPVFGTKTTLKYLRDTYPDFSYKQATLNPTNPEDLATREEASLVNTFKNNPGQKQLTGTRQVGSKSFLYIARPIRIQQASCLQCHNRPSDAPASMLVRYKIPLNTPPGKRGFGWKLNQVVGAQIVSVPMSISVQMAHQTFRTMMLFLVAVFALTLLAMNVLLRRLVIAPVSKLSKAADDISMGRVEGVDLEAKGTDEIATLTGSFNRMQRSLQQALRLLER